MSKLSGALWRWGRKRKEIDCADWWKSDSSVNGEPQGNCGWNSSSEDVVASSPFFSHPVAKAPQRACSQAVGAHARTKIT